MNDHSPSQPGAYGDTLCYFALVSPVTRSLGQTAEVLLRLSSLESHVVL